MDTSNEASPRTQIIAPILSLDPGELGRKVREIWIAWAKEQPNPKLSWLKPWEELSEPDKEVDRRIGMQIAVGVVARLRSNLDNQKDLFERHTKAVADFLNELYAISVDPLADGPKEVSEMRAELLAAAIRDRDLRKYKDRIEWLHVGGEKDAEGYEWGIYRVKSDQHGKVIEALHTLTDLSDLDAEMEREKSITRPA